MTRRSTEIAVGALPIILLLTIWHGIAASGMAPPSLLPSPVAVFARLGEQLRNITFLHHAAATLYRLFTGFAIAVVLGVLLGLAATGSRTFGKGTVQSIIPLSDDRGLLNEVTVVAGVERVDGMDDVARLLEHLGGAPVRGAAAAEVRGDALAQLFGLADVEHLAISPEEPVDAGAVGDARQDAAELVRVTARSG